MGKRKDTPTRREINEKIDRNTEAMEAKEIDLDKIASDVETVKRTLENLDFDGTAEGVEQIENAIESAEDVTVDVFDREDENLETIQADGQEHEEELQDRHHSSESDLSKVSNASAGIDTKETIDSLVVAKEAAIREIEYFEEQISRAINAREQSDKIQEKHRSRAHKK